MFGTQQNTDFIFSTVNHREQNPATMSTIHSMQSSMQFGPEWMRAKPVKPHAPSPPPPASAPAAGASSYSALVSPAPPPPAEKDESQPFRYSREEMLKIYRDGGGKGGLGLEVERYEGIVREAGSDPVGLREMGESEKKVRDPVLCTVRFFSIFSPRVVPLAFRWLFEFGAASTPIHRLYVPSVHPDRRTPKAPAQHIVRHRQSHAGEIRWSKHATARELR